MSLLDFLEYVGTFVFAISGVMTAVDKKFDVVGTLIIGAVTAIGGGTLRDILIGSTPAGWMQSSTYLYVIFSAFIISYFFEKYIRKLRRSLFIFDTIGLGLFTILGLQKTVAMGLSTEIAVVMGVVSAVFGGVIRDVLTNEVPLIFRKEIYASACFLGALVFLLINLISNYHQVNVIVSVLVVIGIRTAAVKLKWSLPFNPRM
jgi:uncharacterized membrane protein YeiH